MLLGDDGEMAMKKSRRKKTQKVNRFFGTLSRPLSIHLSSPFLVISLKCHRLPSFLEIFLRKDLRTVS